VHNIGVILANKYKSGPAHIRRQLINFVKPAVDDVFTEVWIAKVSNDEIVGFAYRIFVVLKINSTNPESIRLQAFD